MADSNLLKILIKFESKLEKAEKEWSKRFVRIAKDYREVQTLYKEDRNVFSIAGELSTSVLESAKETFEKALMKAQGVEEFKEESYKTWVRDAELKASVNLENRLETIYRTNFQSAMAEGRLAKAKERGVVGFRRIAIKDKDVRENHLAANGLIYSIDSPNLDWFSLPWGFNCRCTEQPISFLEAERRGLLDDNMEFIGMSKEQWIQRKAKPDEGFE